jgi:hypothetical protein
LAERSAFVRFINDTLAGADNCLGVQLPLDPCTNEIFDVVRDGVLLRFVVDGIKVFVFHLFLFCIYVFH